MTYHMLYFSRALYILCIVHISADIVLIYTGYATALLLLTVLAFVGCRRSCGCNCSACSTCPSETSCYHYTAWLLLVNCTAVTLLKLLLTNVANVTLLLYLDGHCERPESNGYQTLGNTIYRDAVSLTQTCEKRNTAIRCTNSESACVYSCLLMSHALIFHTTFRL